MTNRGPPREDLYLQLLDMVPVLEAVHGIEPARAALIAVATRMP